MPDLSKKVSVIIPNYNYAHFLPETVESVLTQTYNNLECIIVDDGSTDNSKDIISQLEAKDSRVRPVFKKNGGLSSARNAGMNAASGDLISFIDSDDKWKKDKLKNQMELLEKEKCDFIFSNYEGFYPDGEIEPFKHEFGDPVPFDFIKLNPIAGSASSVLITKELAEKTGYFDETLKSTEDHDYWFRCLVSGAKMRFCDAYDVLIRLHRTSMSTNEKRMNENNFKVLIKQLEIFPEKFKQEDLNKFKTLVTSKFQSLLWVARDTRDKGMIRSLYRNHIRFLGLNYSIGAFLKKNLIYDLRLMVNLN